MTGKKEPNIVWSCYATLCSNNSHLLSEDKDEFAM